MTAGLFQPGPPFAYLTDMDDQTFGGFVTELAAAHPGASVFRLRGDRARTEKDFFDEAASAFQFPSYFGKNWNAFDECFDDLISPESPVIIAISDGDQVFVDAPPTNMSNLAVVVGGANEAMEPDDEPASLKLLVQVAPESRPAIHARLTEAGLAWGEIQARDL